MNIFSSHLKRNEILSYSKILDFSKCQKIAINIHRNHAFEPLESVITPFLHYSGLKADFTLSSYDDSLNFDKIIESDLEIIWLDISRYKSDIAEYLESRLEFLRQTSKAPILAILMDIADSKTLQNTRDFSNIVEHITHCEILCISQILQERESKQILDELKSSITGTRLSNIACLHLAQILGLRLIPSLLLPSLKAIVLDLDNTLYYGILGEDGAKSLTLTQEHKALQEKILTYKKQGFLLALASKNEEQDAKAMFELRSDFPLQWSDFDYVQVNWNPKSENLAHIAQYFNIGLDSILFIDDNPAEIENVKPTGVKTILATEPSEVLRILELFPQMRKTRINKEDSLRANDIAANAKRKELENLSQEEYFKNLQIELEFHLDDRANMVRIHELLNKTNQFIANYTRPTQEQVKSWLDSQNYVIVSIAMRDKLSDSGNIAIIVGRSFERDMGLSAEKGEIDSEKCAEARDFHNEKCKNGGSVEKKCKGAKEGITHGGLGKEVSLEIIDIVVSCRALGRRLESLMLYKAFALMSENLGVDSQRIIVHYQKGERNKPFLQTLAHLSGEDMVALESKQSIEIAQHAVDMRGLRVVVR
ncbi:HAD family hydrolase [Helicobacter didelphidarum]|uniref:HAD family hydrolase n=1 Tax=Helicobacter didelphidarum TaxID=2040648 RepID=A0A3D8INM9_9HELI|nr:HAD-IIIC family phosphatase [Helicobacter didelphidarum]RDU66516.1 HAD family hydrolase [Helicobacter didelphidarum]